MSRTPRPSGEYARPGGSRSVSRGQLAADCRVKGQNGGCAHLLLLIFNVRHGQELHRLALEENLGWGRGCQRGWLSARAPRNRSGIPCRGWVGEEGSREYERPEEPPPKKRAARLISQPCRPEISQEAERSGVAVNAVEWAIGTRCGAAPRCRVVAARRAVGVCGGLGGERGEQRGGNGSPGSCKADGQARVVRPWAARVQKTGARGVRRLVRGAARAGAGAKSRKVERAVRAGVRGRGKSSTRGGRRNGKWGGSTGWQQVPRAGVRRTRQTGTGSLQLRPKKVSSSSAPRPPWRTFAAASPPAGARFAPRSCTHLARRDEGYPQTPEALRLGHFSIVHAQKRVTQFLFPKGRVRRHPRRRGPPFGIQDRPLPGPQPLRSC